MTYLTARCVKCPLDRRTDWADSGVMFITLGQQRIFYAIRHPSHPLAIILSSTAARIDLQSSYALFEAQWIASCLGTQAVPDDVLHRRVGVRVVNSGTVRSHASSRSTGNLRSARGA
jgi:hypothetical protein